MATSDSAASLAERLEEAVGYKDFVLRELRKRELQYAEIEGRIRELERAGQDLEPHRFLKNGDAAIIRTIAESRKENARLLNEELQQLAEAGEGVEKARERLQMAKEEIEELKALMQKEQED